MEALILRFGMARVIGASVLLLAILLFGGMFGFAKVKAWYYEGKSERLEVKLDVAKADNKVLKADAKQTAAAVENTAATVAAQDTHFSEIAAATDRGSRIIDERIKTNPVVVPLVPDPIVYAQVREADDRARAALDRLRGTPRP